MPNQAPRFSPGFRFSPFDGAVLLVGFAASLGLAMLDPWVALATAFVIIHFFLFCNVFRISRPPELVWAALFAALVLCSLLFDAITWPHVFAVSGFATSITLPIEIRRPSYHGVFWRRVNPALPDWWRTHHGQ